MSFWMCANICESYSAWYKIPGSKEEGGQKCSSIWKYESWDRCFSKMLIFINMCNYHSCNFTSNKSLLYMLACCILKTILCSKFFIPSWNNVEVNSLGQSHISESTVLLKIPNMSLQNSNSVDFFRSFYKFVSWLNSWTSWVEVGIVSKQKYKWKHNLQYYLKT